MKTKKQKIKTMMFIRIPTIGRRQLALTAEKTEVRNNNRRGCREKSKKLTREYWLQL